MTTTKLTPAQLDRACGTVLGSAVGDALGAPYEFGLAKVGPDGPQMIGGGLDLAATGADLRDDHADRPELPRVVRHQSAQQRQSDPHHLGQVGAEPTGATMTATSYDLHARTGRRDVASWATARRRKSDSRHPKRDLTT